MVIVGFEEAMKMAAGEIIVTSTSCSLLQSDT